MNKYFVIFLFLLSSISCIAKQEMLPVSLIELISLPDKFYNKSIYVMGYLKGQRLFLTKDHAGISDTFSSVSLEDLATINLLLMNDCQESYVRISGTFLKKNKTNYIVDIKFIDNILENKECWVKPTK